MGKNKKTNEKEEKEKETASSLLPREEIQESLTAIQAHIMRIQKLLRNEKGEDDVVSEAVAAAQEKISKEIVEEPNGERVIEGVFNGCVMVGPDGKQYQVPPNYASKSKLVEGDLLKLSISPRGSFIFKQIGPIERERLVGTLVRDHNTGEYRVESSGKSHKVLAASITYFKAEEGDEIIILIPKNAESAWAAVENVIKQ